MNIFALRWVLQLEKRESTLHPSHTSPEAAKKSQNKTIRVTTEQGLYYQFLQSGLDLPGWQHVQMTEALPAPSMKESISEFP